MAGSKDSALSFESRFFLGGGRLSRTFFQCPAIGIEPSVPVHTRHLHVHNIRETVDITTYMVSSLPNCAFKGHNRGFHHITR